MNWKQRYDKPGPGSKILVVNTNVGCCNQFYKKGKTYTILRICSCSDTDWLTVEGNEYDREGPLINEKCFTIK